MLLSRHAILAFSLLFFLGFRGASAQNTTFPCNGDGVCESYPDTELCDTCPEDCGSCNLIDDASCPTGFYESGLAASFDAQLFFSMEVEAAETVHCVTSSLALTGDADLFLRFEGSENLFECASGLDGNDEVCTVTATDDETLVVVLYAFFAFSGVELNCTCLVCGDGTCEVGESCDYCPSDCGECEIAGSCPDGFNETALASEVDEISFRMEVSAGDYVTCIMSPTSSSSGGDADLYLHFLGSPEIVCSSAGFSSTEECSALVDVDGTLFVTLSPYFPFDGVDLACTCGDPPPPSPPPTPLPPPPSPPPTPLPPSVCGDGTCDRDYPIEFCDTCPSDCGGCNPMGACPDGFTLSGLTAGQGERIFFSMEVSAGANVFCTTFSLEDTGDADLYLRFEGDESPDCVSESFGNIEGCASTAAADAILIVEVRAFSDFTNLQLDCTCPSNPVSIAVSTPRPSPPPTEHPTSNPTVEPTSADRVQAKVDAVVVTFEQSREIPNESKIVFEDIVSSWFDAFYNGSRRRKLLGLFGIRNMKCQIVLKEQSVSGTTNVVSFSQVLSYDAIDGSSRTIEELILSPWFDRMYNLELGKMLTMELPGSFREVGMPIRVPTILGEDPSSSSSSNTALYALFALLVIPLAGIGYVMYRKQKGQSGEGGGQAEAKHVLANEQDSAGGSSAPQIFAVGSHDETHNETDEGTGSAGGHSPRLGPRPVRMIDPEERHGPDFKDQVQGHVFATQVIDA